MEERRERRCEMVDLIERVARLEAKIEAAQSSLKLAHDNMNYRLEGMNEFRQTLTDQAGKFVTRHEILGFISAAMFLTIAVVTMILKFK